MMLTSLKKILNELQSLNREPSRNLQHKYSDLVMLECIDLTPQCEVSLREENHLYPPEDISFCHSKEEIEKRWRWLHDFMSGACIKYMWVEVTRPVCTVQISATRDSIMYDQEAFQHTIPIGFHFLDTVEDADYAIRKHVYPLQMEFHNIRAWEVCIQYFLSRFLHEIDS